MWSHTADMSFKDTDARTYRPSACNAGRRYAPVERCEPSVSTAPGLTEAHPIVVERGTHLGGVRPITRSVQCQRLSHERLRQRQLAGVLVEQLRTERMRRSAGCGGGDASRV